MTENHGVAGSIPALATNSTAPDATEMQREAVPLHALEPTAPNVQAEPAAAAGAVLREVQAALPTTPPTAAPAGPSRAEVLADHRRHCQEIEGKGWQHLDDMVFKVSAGGLAISVTLLGVIDTIAIGSMVWMYSGWASWAAALLWMMVSIWTGQMGLRSQISHIDQNTFDNEGIRHEGAIGALTPYLNIAAVVSCLVGLACLLVFAVLNV